MRFLLVLIILALAIWKLWPEPPVPTAEESFIGPQVQTLNKMEQFEEDYMKALDEKKERLEREADGG